MLMYAYELEALPELEDEYESAWEDEWEGDRESEQFFGALANLASRAIHAPTVRRAALSAGRSTLRGLLSEAEDEGEFEWEWETELEMKRPVSTIAMMEHLGHCAAKAQREAEAEAFIGALVPLAARLIPKAASALTRAAPHLVRGLSQATRTLRRNPQTRPFVRTLPTVMRRTAASLARRAVQGQQVTPRAAVRTLARQTVRVVGDPRQSVQAYRRSRALDRQYHRAAHPRSVAAHGKGRVNYNGRTVSDPVVRQKLQEIADLFGSTVVLTSGDRSHVPPGGSTKSLHLAGRAADFYVEGVSLIEAFNRIRASRILDGGNFEFIHHLGVCNGQPATIPAHLHLGHYSTNKNRHMIEECGSYRKVGP
jgi:hypothetical protein